jgi:hypothetical protein
MNEFSQAVREQLGYYVYVLKDPRSKAIFYIGKGNNNRVFQHVRGSIHDATETEKLNLIRDIHSAGLEVEHYILRHGLDEKMALEIESACIDLLDLDAMESEVKTTNRVKGHNSWERGLKTVDEVAQFYDAVAIDLDEPTIILNVNRLYQRFMTEQELYEITRSAWIVAAKRRKLVHYAIAAYRGLVREVYEVTNWNQKEKRWEFTGKRAKQSIRDKYLNQSLKNYIKQGSRNPVRYSF